jgi:hypothetical protein
MPLTDQFNNTPPATITIGRAAAFDNTAPAFSAPSRGAAFSNTGPAAATITRAAAFNNATPDKRASSMESLSPKIAKAQTTTSITISSLVIGATIDGVTLAWEDLVLVASQVAPAQNGLYRVTASTPVRATDHAVFFTVQVGPLGTVNRGKQFSYNPITPYVVDTTAVNFTALVAQPH